MRLLVLLSVSLFVLVDGLAVRHMHRQNDPNIVDKAGKTIVGFGKTGEQSYVNYIKDAPLLSIYRNSGKPLAALPTTSKSTMVEKKKDDKDEDVKLVEINSDIQTELDVDVDTAIQVYPAGGAAMAVGAGGAAAVTRATIRGGFTDAQAVSTGAGGAFPPFTNVYIKDVSGRVTSASYYLTDGIASAPGDRAEQWCDVAWNHGGTNGWYTPGNQNARVRSEYQTGHIVAASHGGNNYDPLNFIPLHFQSNTNGGRWQRIETIATAVKARAGGAVQATGVDITFLYNDAGAGPIAALYPAGLPAVLGARPFVPIGGDYEVSVSRRMMKKRFRPTGGALAAVIGATGATWDTLHTTPAAVPALNAWCDLNMDAAAAVFCKRAVRAPVGAAVNANRWVLNTPWRNAPDMALTAGPAAGAIDAARYVIQANLF